MRFPFTANSLQKFFITKPEQSSLFNSKEHIINNCHIELLNIVFLYHTFPIFMNYSTFSCPKKATWRFRDWKINLVPLLHFLLLSEIAWFHRNPCIVKQELFRIEINAEQFLLWVFQLEINEPGWWRSWGYKFYLSELEIIVSTVLSIYINIIMSLYVKWN